MAERKCGENEPFLLAWLDHRPYALLELPEPSVCNYVLRMCH